MLERLPPELLSIILSLLTQSSFYTLINTSRLYNELFSRYLYLAPHLPTIRQWKAFLRTIRKQNTIHPYGYYVREINLSFLSKHAREEYAVWDFTLEIIADNCPQLRALRLPHCKQLSGNCLKYLASRIHTLYELELTGVDTKEEKFIRQLVRSNPQLTLVNLSFNAQISDSLVNILSALPLTHLNLAHVSLPPSSTFLFQSLPNLTFLDLAATFLDTLSVSPLFSLQRLTFLNLAHLDIEPSAYLSSITPCLTQLFFSNLSLFTFTEFTNVLTHLSHSCPNLNVYFYSNSRGRLIYQKTMQKRFYELQKLAGFDVSHTETWWQMRVGKVGHGFSEWKGQGIITGTRRITRLKVGREGPVLSADGWKRTRHVEEVDVHEVSRWQSKNKL